MACDNKLTHAYAGVNDGRHETLHVLYGITPEAQPAYFSDSINYKIYMSACARHL